MAVRLKAPVSPAALAAYLQLPLMRNAYLLGLDIGSTKVGVAISDVNRQFASAVTRIDRRPWPNPPSDFPRHIAKELTTIIERRRVCGLVVGWPLLPNGLPGQRCQEVKHLIQQAYLYGMPPVPYIVWDETFSTQEARESLWENNKMARKRMVEVEDQVSATIILQVKDFLSSEVMRGEGADLERPDTMI